MGKKKDSLELYFHIPFCIKKCDYCDFLSGPATRAGQEAYIYALLREMKAVSAIEKRTVDTVFIGGGTPFCAGVWHYGKTFAGNWEKFSAGSRCGGYY